MFFRLKEEGFGRTVVIPDLSGGPGCSQTLYPLEEVNFKIGKYLSHRFKFTYD